MGKKRYFLNLVNNLGIFSYDFHKKTGLKKYTSKKWLNYGSKDRLHVIILEIHAIEIYERGREIEKVMQGSGYNRTFCSL